MSQPRTMRTAGEGAGTDASKQWMCGHVHRTGQMRNTGAARPMAWRCINCADAARKAKERA